jgi:hypothetical protein
VQRLESLNRGSVNQGGVEQIRAERSTHLEIQRITSRTCTSLSNFWAFQASPELPKEHEKTVKKPLIKLNSGFVNVTYKPHVHTYTSPSMTPKERERERLPNFAAKKETKSARKKRNMSLVGK